MSPRIHFKLALLAMMAWLATGAAPVRATPPLDVGDVRYEAIDEARLLSAGIRKLTGTRLILYTDVAEQLEVAELPAVFEQAYRQWCDYFDQADRRDRAWQMTGCLMADRKRFIRAGLLPEALNRFRHGYCAADRLWLDEQPTAYYRRHLLLHEGTHGFMHTVLGSCGPPWYGEGLAELLATHRWQGGKLTMNIMPKDRDEVPQLGRIKLVHNDSAAGRARSIDEVLSLDARSAWDNDRYAWSWALVAMLDGVPRYQKPFRALAHDVQAAGFDRRLQTQFADEVWNVADDWVEFVTHIEHGYDLQRGAIVFAPGMPLPAMGGKCAVAADRGWQSSGLRVDRGKRYRIAATGRVQLATVPKPWISEAQGVSIRYYAGRPLGLLQLVVRPDERTAEMNNPFLTPRDVGASAALEPGDTGTLYFRVNDFPSERADNAGSFDVRVTMDDGK